MRTLPLPALLTLSAPLLAACSANVAGSVEAADADSNATSAVVVVERTVGASDARATAVARFVRMRSGAVDDDALRMVGATVDFPALGSCVTAPAKRAGAARAVELLDVGAISLEANGLRTSLQARQIPDVVDLLSGVVYATPTADADALPASSLYVLRAAGSVEQDVAPFSVDAAAPDEPSQIRIAGQDVGSQDVGSLVGLGSGVAVEVSWEAGAADDFVYLDVAGSVGASVPAGAQAGARCLFSDVGRATLAPAAFGEMTGGTITIHRLHREPFHVKGVDTGEVRFDFARVVAFSRL